MKRFQFALCAALAGLSILSSITPQPAQAWPFGKKAKAVQEAVQKVQTYQPPPVDAIATRCEPIRKKILEINRGNKFSRTMMSPKTAYLISRHNKCRAQYMSEEMEYLRHVDIEQSPSLPKLKTDAPPANQPPKDVSPSGSAQSKQP